MDTSRDPRIGRLAAARTSTDPRQRRKTGTASAEGAEAAEDERWEAGIEDELGDNDSRVVKRR